MAETVGQHGLAAFVNPTNGDALDATVVKANDNTMRTAYVSHDDDGGIHVQSSLIASRPAAGTAGRKWLTTDTGSVKLWYDNGSAWQEISYLPSSGSITISGDVTFSSNVTLGDATSDTVSFVSRVASAITPSITNTNDLGSSSLRWKDGYFAGGVYVSGSSSFGGTVSAGAASVTGAVSAGSFSGAINAADLSSGTLPDARFPATLPAISGANLTSLNATNISSGTINNSRLPTTISGTLAVYPTLSGAVSSPRNTIKLGDSDTVFLTTTASSTLIKGDAGTGSLTGLTGFAGPTGTTLNVSQVQYIQISVSGSTAWYIPIFKF